jgi:hemolysin III
MARDEIVSFVFRNPVSAGTHLMWCVLGVYVTGLLWRLSRGDRLRQISTATFGLSMVLLYGASGAYHAVPRETPLLMGYLQRLDHSAIYVLIAGSATPVFAVVLRGRLRLVLLSLMWGLAAAGIAAKWLLPWPPYQLTVAFYVIMGWVGLLPVWQLVRAIGLHGVFWAFLGGVLYTFGAVCDAAEWPVLLPGVIGYHEVLHLADMGGTLAHLFLIVRYVVPFRR